MPEYIAIVPAVFGELLGFRTVKSRIDAGTAMGFDPVPSRASALARANRDNGEDPFRTRLFQILDPNGQCAMNFYDYEREQFFVYEEFAETVRLILEKAIQGSEAPRPQAIQARAKSIKSVRDRLEEGGNLDSNEIEKVRRDLAGVRIIFYTNTDVDRFSNLRLITENFHIEKDATRIHHPMKENDERRYRAIHYTVSLKDDRAKLSEYSKFNGLRCEIQI